MKLAKIKKSIGRSSYHIKLNWKKFFQSPFLLSDIEFVKRNFKEVFGYPLNLDNPQTFNEKIQWRKIYDRQPIYIQFSDKLAVREYVANRIGQEYLIDILQIVNNPNRIDFDSFPKSFIIKPNHSSGMYLFIHDKKDINLQEIQKTCRTWLKTNHYVIAREWGYKHLHPRIIIEPLLDRDDDQSLGYKFFCFHGKVHVIRVAHSRTLFTPEWEIMPYEVDRQLKITPPGLPPDNLQEMITIAEKLAKGHDFLRIDLFNHHGKIYFNEITVYPFAGYTKFTPEGFDQHLGKLWQIPEKSYQKWSRLRKIGNALDYLLSTITRLFL